MKKIKELVKNKEWQKVRLSLIGKWNTDQKFALNQLKKYLGNINTTSEEKLRIVMNYLTGTGFRTGKIDSKEIRNLRALISAEIRRRKYKV